MKDELERIKQNFESIFGDEFDPYILRQLLFERYKKKTHDFIENSVGDKQLKEMLVYLDNALFNQPINDLESKLSLKDEDLTPDKKREIIIEETKKKNGGHHGKNTKGND